MNNLHEKIISLIEYLCVSRNDLIIKFQLYKIKVDVSFDVEHTLRLDYTGLFINAYLRERRREKKKRIQHSIDRQEQLFNILPFLTTTRLIVIM